MASVSLQGATAPLGGHDASAPKPITHQTVSEAFRKYKEMTQRGVSQDDPELASTRQFLLELQQRQMLRKQIQQQAQQAQQAPTVNGVMTNGVTPQAASQTSPKSASLTPITTNGTSTAPPVTSPGAPTMGSMSIQQTKMLKGQISAFKLLARNNGVPLEVQQAIFSMRQSRHQKLLESMSGGQSSPNLSQKIQGHDTQAPNESAGTGVDGAAPADTEEEYKPVARFNYKTVTTPLEAGILKESVSFQAHRLRNTRVQVPSVFPPGVDFDQFRHEREKSLYNRMRSRYAALKALPADMAHVDYGQDKLSPSDSLKLNAIIEMKSLSLYSKQRSLREKIGRQMMHYDNIAMITNRSVFRRAKKAMVRETRISEKLEKQQRDAREENEKAKRTEYLNSVCKNRHDVLSRTDSLRHKTQRLGRVMTAHHTNIEKEEQKRIERTAKQRLQALKANDEEAYLKLLDQAKDTRITHLLRQTDGFLHQLAASVRAQQRKAAKHVASDDIIEDDSVEDGDEDGEQQPNRKIDYYAVAHRIREEVTEQAHILTGGSLKEYQIKGLQWMISLYNNNLNGILADEMGLGKTIQTISLITYLIERKQQRGPYLVIVPLSTLTNWDLEFAKWAPTVSRLVYKGPPAARKSLQEKIRHGNFQVLLTTYEYIIKDRQVLSKIKWFHMIIDEGHRMKNAQSKLSATISQNYHTRYRLILTGTPLQNNLGELWAMLNFVLPNIFKSAKTFDEWFNTPFANTGGQDKIELTEEEQILVIRRLHKVLRPFLLRRLKKDVEKDLPDKVEKVVKVKFSALQARLYRQMMTHQKIAVSDGKSGKTSTRGLSNMIMQLRKLCNHPFVFEEVENQMNPTSTSNDLLWRTAGKFELLDRILPKYQASGHRVLVFFQMTAIMDIMEDFLRMRAIKYLRLDGMTKSDDRPDLLKEFNDPNSDIFMFLLSTRAGGLGLNLQTADTVIIYDSDWNPHQDLQAQDRAHRIGQKNEVRILRLITSNSFEEKILERARFKLDMDGKVIQAGRFDNKSSENDRDTMLRTLLESAELADSLEQDEMDDNELNLILARTEEEYELFRQMDMERDRDPIYGTAPGCRGVPRLMSEKELPDIYMLEENPVEEEPELILGRGARERTKVKYDDGLTEEQWLMAVDDDDDSPEAAAARKQARKDRREQNKLRRHGKGPDEESPRASRASTEEQETPARKRGRKPGQKSEKRKADDDNDEPPAKKRRGPQGRPKAITSAASDSMDAGLRFSLQSSMRRVYDSLMKLEVDDPETDDKDDDDDEPPKRIIIGPFVSLPPKRLYADYYIVTQYPICMKDIDKRIKKEEYRSLSGFRKDLQLLVDNCRTYNEESSLLFADANVIEDFFDRKIKEEMEKHPELGFLENSGKSDAADKPAGLPVDGPATPAGPSQPTAQMRIKVVSNNAASNAAPVNGYNGH